jgi:hypothetical protein
MRTRAGFPAAWMAGIGVDVAGFAGIDKQRAPGAGKVLGHVEGAERVVAAGDHR